MSAALIGSGIGLGLGAAYLSAGMAGHAAEHARAEQIADAAAHGYTGSYLEAQGRGLRTGLERYGFEVATPAPQAGSAQDATPPAAKIRRRAELECLTDAVYYEARGESPRGQAAVAQVVLNRVKHPAFPKTVCGVVFQGAGRAGCQFSFACDGSMRQRREAIAWNRARKVATRALAGAALADIGSATHFHTTAVAPSWGPQMLRVAMVGTHVFYKLAPYRLRAASSPAAETAVLISAPASETPELRIAPTFLEKTAEASLQPSQAVEPVVLKVPAVPPTPAQPAKPAEAAALTSAQAAAAGAS